MGNQQNNVIYDKENGTVYNEGKKEVYFGVYISINHILLKNEKTGYTNEDLLGLILMSK